MSKIDESGLFQSEIQSLPLVYRGKVRDSYAVSGNQLLIVTTDRLSAFDVVMRQPIPDKGKVLTRGRIAGLIATGAGFQPQLSGRENLFLNGAILGMTEAETLRKFDEIVDFAGLGKFLDTPVSHYSSGMYARLGFSIAVHVDADIFLADEVLAVGDRPADVEAAEAAGIRAYLLTTPGIPLGAPGMRRIESLSELPV